MFKYQYMHFAIKQAKFAQKNNQIPVGALLVNKNGIISSAYNNVSKDPTAHAEILVIRKACKLFSSTSFLYDSNLYVTLEPCPMCIQAISFARIKRLYFGAYNLNNGGVENGAKILQFCNYVPEIYGGILETECSLLIKKFFKKLRK